MTSIAAFLVSSDHVPRRIMEPPPGHHHNPLNHHFPPHVYHGPTTASLGASSFGGSFAGSSLSLASEHHHHHSPAINFPRGIFRDVLKKIVSNLQASIEVPEDVIDELERLVYKILAKILQTPGSSPAGPVASSPQAGRGFPSSVKEVKETIRRIFPAPLDQLVIDDASSASEAKKEPGAKKGGGSKSKASSVPLDSLSTALQKEFPGDRIDTQVLSFLVSVMEYMAADIWKLVVKYAKNIRHTRVDFVDVKVALHSDHIIQDLLNEEDVDFSFISEEGTVGKRTSLTYEENVKEFVLEEEQHIRDLNMIIKVFRSAFMSLRCHGVTESDVDQVFGDIQDVHASVVNFHGLLEDMMEMTSENSVPSVPQVGTCFMEMAEGAEFDVFVRYAEDVLQPETMNRLQEILGKSEVVRTLSSAGKGFKDAVKYVLPKLLLGPIYHFFHYMDVLKTFVELTEDEEDRETLNQVKGILSPLHSKLTRVCTKHEMPQLRKHWENSLRFQGHIRDRKAAVQKMNEIQRKIEGWEGKELQACCHELLVEGKLWKVMGKGVGTRAMFSKGETNETSERYAFLFDSVLVLCKQNEKTTRKMSAVVSGSTAPAPEFRLKKKYFIRRLDVTDREDTDDVRHAFVLSTRRGPHVGERARSRTGDTFNGIRDAVRDGDTSLIKGGADWDAIVLCAKTAEEKSHWMATLTALQTRPMLERMLEGKLAEEEKAHPLQLPSVLIYPYAEEDSDTNIVFEPDQTSGGNPVVRGGTLLKLVERLTYHLYASPKFVRTFLTTYRSFCSPGQLLELLIQRFNIPLPHSDNDLEALSVEGLSRVDADHSTNASSKRFRKEYVQPVQLRVLNVIRHWVDEHFYDFERDETLLHKLLEFINSRKGKSMSKWIHSISKIIQRRCEMTDQGDFNITFETHPPTIEWHLTKNPSDFNIITLHPVEMARQITLIQSKLYRAVKPSELIGCAWQKENKDSNSPNLLRLVCYTNTLIQWYKRNVVEAENFQERVASMARILEMMVVFLELNNFNGVLEVVAAMNSSPVYRLKHTFARITRDHALLWRALQDAVELNDNHYRKYMERLRSINPPVVPFFGMYLSNINHIEEGNPDFLRSDSNLINFSKRRKISEITAEIQQYQNQRYCLQDEPYIQEYLKNLNPLGEMSEKEFDDYLYTKSTEVEPRGADAAAVFPPRFGVDLKSPGIRPHKSKGRSQNSSGSGGGGGGGAGQVFTFTRLHEEEGDSPASPNRVSTPSSTPSTPATTPLPSPLSPGGLALLNRGSGASFHHSANRSVPGLDTTNENAAAVPVLQPPPIPPRRPKVGASVGGGGGGASSGSCTTPSSTHSNHDSPLQSPVGVGSNTIFNSSINGPPLSPTVMSSSSIQAPPPSLPPRRREALPDPGAVELADAPRTPPLLPPRLPPSSDVVPPLPPRSANTRTHSRAASGALVPRLPPISGGSFPPPPPSPVVNLPNSNSSPTFLNSAQTSPLAIPPATVSSSASGNSRNLNSSGSSHPPSLNRRYTSRTFFPPEMALPLTPGALTPLTLPPHSSIPHHNPPAHSTTPSVFDNPKFEFPSACGILSDSPTPDDPVPQLPPKTWKSHRKKSDWKFEERVD